MKICSVLSNLGAWNMLQRSYPSEFLEINHTFDSLLFDEGPFLYASKKGDPIPRYIDESIKNHQILNISNQLSTYFLNYGWKIDQIFDIRKVRLSAIKNTIGINWQFGRYANIESDLFVNFPLLMQSGICKVILEVIPTKQIIHQFPRTTSSFEVVKDRISPLKPFPIKFPFLVIGVGEKNDGKTTIYEMTSELDQFLLNTVEYSFIEMVFHTEKNSFDFKLVLPEPSIISKEVCAFANQKKGGIILVGVNNLGELVGIHESSIDSTKLRVTQLVHNNCEPSPHIDCEVFPVPDRSEMRLLVIHIHEYDRKPCMVGNRIYTRRGSSACPANSDEVREMVLGHKEDII
jgi:hypothetical protein